MTLGDLSVLVGTLGVNAEGDKAVVGIVGQRVNHHSKYHDDVLTSLSHREERDDVIGQALPAQALEQNPTDAQLQCQTDQEATDKEQQLALEIVLGLEYPVAVPQETVDYTEDVTHDIRDAISQPQARVQYIEHDQSDKRVQHTYHAILEQLYARLSSLVLVNLHDNSFIAAKLDNFNELTKYFSFKFPKQPHSVIPIISNLKSEIRNLKSEI